MMSFSNLISLLAITNPKLLKSIIMRDRYLSFMAFFQVFKRLIADVWFLIFLYETPIQSSRIFAHDRIRVPCIANQFISSSISCKIVECVETFVGMFPGN